MNKTGNVFTKVRNAIGALFIVAIVLIVPLFSVWQIGRFFYGGPKRSDKALSSLVTRPADTNQTDPRLFDEPLISVTFDDGYETTYTKAMPLLQKYGIRTTQYVLSGTADDPTYVSWGQIKRMQEAGHEIACHTVNHADLRTLDDEDLDIQVRTCKEELSKRFGPVYNFASPYGSQDKRTLAVIGKYFKSQRNTNGDPTNGVSAVDVNLRANFDPINIIGVTVRQDTTVEQLRQLVAYTKANNAWLVLTYHQADDHNSKFSVTEKDFEHQFAYLSSTDVRIVTMQEALKNYKQQRVGQ
ncbi:MAG: putative xylanase/chitin deacetylase [Candidatus Saccharibacteria bacterium]|nr:putative xylanase/chitin deacetylase [Candidatus Saccharibacteria bacterium]